jgi:hypothetical protein
MVLPLKPLKAGGSAPARSGKQGSRSFLKKRTKKLLLSWLGVASTSETNLKKSFASSLQKRRFFLTAG